MKILRDKVVVVTGGASGIGRATCLAFARSGMHVVVADVDEAGMADTCGAIRGLGRRAFAVPTDVARVGDVQRLYERTLRDAGGVHVIMNNAGIARFGPALELSDDDWQRVMDINLWGVIHGCRIFGPHLTAQGEGHIVNTASLAGIAGISGCASYVVAKFGVVGLSEALRWELATHGVGVTVLCPGLVKSRIAENAGHEPVARTVAKFGQDPSRLAARVVRAVQKDQARVLFGLEPHVASSLRAVSPALLDSVGKALAKSTRERVGRASSE